MRKRISSEDNRGDPPVDAQDWLDLEQLVEVELTSEDAEHPVESALLMNAGSGWRAQQPGHWKVGRPAGRSCVSSITSARQSSTRASLSGGEVSALAEPITTSVLFPGQSHTGP